MEEEEKHIQKLLYLADRSRELLDKQINSHRARQSNNGVLIGVIGLFVTFFIGGITGADRTILLISTVPILSFTISLILLLYLMISKPLDQGIDVSKYQELANKHFEEVVLFDVGANNDSFSDNMPKIQTHAKVYNAAVVLLIAATIISTFLLSYNSIFNKI